MKTKIFFSLIIAFSGICNAANKLEIYLPREITVNSDTPTIGDVAVIHGDEALTAKVQAISLGKFSSAGQKMTVDKSIILSRLASVGILGTQINLSGAEEIIISQKCKVISGKEFVDKATTYLTENPVQGSVCQFSTIRMPQDLIVNDVNCDLKFTSMLEESINSQAKILVSVSAGDKPIGSREVIFALKFKCQRAIAKSDLPVGTVLTTENVKIENYVANQPQAANWAAPYGLAVKRTLPINTIILPEMVGSVQPETILKRNQQVLIKVDKMGLVVTAIGRTLQDGRAGEFIKVQNLTSQKVILAKVNQDGSVEPVF